MVAGPGAIDGISKCFSSTGGLSPEELIIWVADRQEEELANRGLAFPGLFGRRLRRSIARICSVIFRRTRELRILGSLASPTGKESSRVIDETRARYPPPFPSPLGLAGAGLAGAARDGRSRPAGGFSLDLLTPMAPPLPYACPAFVNYEQTPRRTSASGEHSGRSKEFWVDGVFIRSKLNVWLWAHGVRPRLAGKCPLRGLADLPLSGRIGRKAANATSLN